MVWRRLLRGWSSQTQTATEEGAGAKSDDAVAETPPDAAPVPALPAPNPRLGGFSFEGPAAERPTAGATVEAPAPDVESSPTADVAAAVRRKAPRRGVKVAERGVGPVLVPSLREQALVYRIAAEARAREEPETVLGLWKAYLDLCPEDGDAWFLYGQCLLSSGLLDAAWGAFVETRRHQPTHGLAAGALGYLSAARGDHDEALRHYRDAVALRPACLDMLSALRAAQLATGRAEEARATEARIQQITDAG